MREARIYVEGGGKGRPNEAVREGFHGFLKDACGPQRTPKVIPCGGRESACEDFLNAIADHPDAFVILLVDAEGPVRAGATRKDHLGWSLEGVDEDQVHLMVQTFEAWVVADADALEAFYDDDFRKKALPQNPNLESVSKNDLNAALAKATRGTKKKSYHKINHGPSILAIADREVVRQKCLHCARLLDVLAQV